MREQRHTKFTSGERLRRVCPLSARTPVTFDSYRSVRFSLEIGTPAVLEVQWKARQLLIKDTVRYETEGALPISILQDIERVDDGQDNLFRLREAVLSHFLGGEVHEFAEDRSHNRSDDQILNAGLFRPAFKNLIITPVVRSIPLGELGVPRHPRNAKDSFTKARVILTIINRCSMSCKMDIVVNNPPFSYLTGIPFISSCTAFH